MKRTLLYILLFLMLPIGRSLAQDSLAKQHFFGRMQELNKQFLDKNYEVTITQNLYVGDLHKPMESSVQKIQKNGSIYRIQTNGKLVLSYPDIALIIDSSDKTITLSAPIEANTQLLTSQLNAINNLPIEEKGIANKTIFKVDMYSLNNAVESTQYHFLTQENKLERIVIYFKEGNYYEDETHRNENQQPVQEFIFTDFKNWNQPLPKLEEFVTIKNKEYTLSSDYSSYQLEDNRLKK